MTVHQIKIKKDVFEPRNLEVRRGDKIQFQLLERPDSAQVSVVGELFADGNQFEVGVSGKEKIISNTAITDRRYAITTGMSTAMGEEMKRLEQSGTVNGSITVMP